MAARKLEYRTEIDAYGEIAVPSLSYWGAKTERSNANKIRLDPLNKKFLESILLVQKACALANVEAGCLELPLGRTIAQSCDEILSGQWQDQFIANFLQASALNNFCSNVWEVLANRAGEILGAGRGTYSIVHPLLHVGLGRDAFDDFDSALRLSLLFIVKDLETGLRDLERLLRRKGLDFDRQMKSSFKAGDKTGEKECEDKDQRLAQSFNIYGFELAKSSRQVLEASKCFYTLQFAGREPSASKRRQLFVEKLSGFSAFALESVSCDESFKSRLELSDYLDFSAALRSLALVLARIANDLCQHAKRLELVFENDYDSNGCTGNNDILQSSEFVKMVSFMVLGYDAANAYLAQDRSEDSKGRISLLAYNLLQSLELLKQTSSIFSLNCIANIGVKYSKQSEF